MCRMAGDVPCTALWACGCHRTAAAPLITGCTVMLNGAQYSSDCHDHWHNHECVQYREGFSHSFFFLVSRYITHSTSGTPGGPPGPFPYLEICHLGLASHIPALTKRSQSSSSSCHLSLHCLLFTFFQTILYCL